MERIQKAVDFLKYNIHPLPRVGMITGTGLEATTRNMEVIFRIPYHEIPHFPVSTTPGHRGTLAVGLLGGRSVMLLEGRFHLYEGYDPKEITFPIRVMQRLGIQVLCISSAAGGLHPRMRPGDLMVVTDHINLTGCNPLVGPNLDPLGPRFPDMTQAYSPKLIELAHQKALELRMRLWEGIYVGVAGPSMETPAETRFLRLIGGQAVGMSTVHEVIAAVHGGLKVLAIVVITNTNLPDHMEEVSLEKVIAVAKGASAQLSRLWEAILRDLSLKEE